MKVDCVSVRFVPSFIVTFGPASTTGAWLDNVNDALNDFWLPALSFAVTATVCVPLFSPEGL